MSAVPDPLAQLIGEGPGIAAIRDQIRKLLQRQTDSRRMPTVLLRGETGTGKGLVARAMHEASVRVSGPFVDVNCAAIPETLLEAEMFGVERGAFTDAQRSRPGLFQLAHRGTIFLDEIGLLPEALQAKLLKAIEEREVRRLGGTRSEAVDVWVVAATSEDLEVAVAAGRFRQDLYYRLAVVTFVLPPLRARGRDVLLLAEHFLARSCRDYGLPPKTLTPAARAAILAYDWPGNVRDLSNAMERVTLLSDAIDVTPDVLALPSGETPQTTAEPATASTLLVAVDDAERRVLLAALNETEWNITRAAARLGVSRNTLRYRIEKHGLRRAAEGRGSRGSAAARRPEVAADTPRPAPPTPPRERRRLALLRAALVIPPGSDGPPRIGRALDLMSAKAGSFGGRLEELTATGVVAVFGLEPVEDAPLRAAHAAMAIVNGVGRLRQVGATTATVKVAIHVDQFSIAPGTGGPIDLEARPHVWAFLESLLSSLQSDGIVASESAVPFLERRFDLVADPALEGSPWRARRVLARTRTGFEPGGPIATFVGRQHELQMLASRFQRAAAGQGQIIGIAGEAGIGKSRLLFELRQGLAAQPVMFLEGQCQSYGSTIPFLPMLDVVRSLCRLVEVDTPEVVAGKVSATLTGLGVEAEHGAYLLHLLGLKDGARLLGARSPEEIKARIFATLNRILLSASVHQPLVILVEDLHWIDPTTEEYLAALAIHLPRAPVLLVATYRSGYRATWIDRSYAMQIALQPLDPQQAGSVVRAILGPGEASASLVEQIVSRGDGNPFFLEELARAVREQGGSPALLVPDTIQEVLLARINRLGPEGKTVLQTAAVLGNDVSVRLLQAIARRPETELRQHLAELRAAEFLVEHGGTREVEYTFKHTLTHDVAYDALPPDERRALHAGIVQAIEATGPDRLFQHVDALARHAFRGEVWDKAFVYQRQAGIKAASRSAHPEAVVCFARALEALEHLPEGRERMEQAVDLHLARANSFIPIAELSPIVDHLREADGLARMMGDQARVGRVASFLSAYYWLIGDHEQAVVHGRRALDIASALGDLTLRVRTNLSLGQAYHVLGDYRQAIEALDRNVDDLQGDLLGRRFGLVGLASVLSRAWLVWCLTELGEFDRAAARGQEAIQIAEAVGDPYSTIASYFALGGLHLRRGEIPQAIQILESALDLCRTWDTQLRLWFAGVAPTLAHAYALSGRAAEAIPLLEQAIQQAVAMQSMFAQPLRLGWLAHACLHAGRIAEARRLAAQALELARRHHERGHEAWIHGIIGEIAGQQDPPDADAAERAYREAIRLAEELGMRPRVAVAHLGLALLYRRTGSEAQAAPHLAAAIASLTALKMPLWLDQVRGDPPLA
jgi:DNA-binding NtrC family response regulator/tetratricopeptide (TPR) repeat protein